MDWAVQMVRAGKEIRVRWWLVRAVQKVRAVQMVRSMPMVRAVQMVWAGKVIRVRWWLIHQHCPWLVRAGKVIGCVGG